MKAKIIIVFLNFLLTALNAYGFDENIFSNDYLNVGNYHITIFSKIKNYLDALSSQSIVTTNSNSITLYQFKKTNSLDLELIFIKIEREIKNDSLSERVYYSFENGQVFSYELIRYGTNLGFSEDLDLRLMRIKATQFKTGYDLLYPQLGLAIKSRNSEFSTLEKISLQKMGFEFSVESFFSEKTAQRNYIYFFTHMEKVQSSLSVRVEGLESNWAPNKFTHFDSSVGEISPSAFYQGLNLGAGLFEELSNSFLFDFESLGFPKLQ